MRIVLMACGCVANAEGTDNKPCCIIHNTEEIVKELPDLKGRKARCEYCGREEESDYNLPFFRSNPNKDYDEYYCGCFGWD